MNYETLNYRVGDIGEVYENVDYHILFTFLEDPEIFDNLHQIKSIKPSCGCTSAYKSDKGISVLYNTGSIQSHLRKIMDKQKFKKKIKIELTDGREFDLQFHGTRIKKKRNG